MDSEVGKHNLGSQKRRGFALSIGPDGPSGSDGAVGDGASGRRGDLRGTAPFGRDGTAACRAGIRQGSGSRRQGAIDRTATFPSRAGSAAEPWVSFERPAGRDREDPREAFYGTTPAGPGRKIQPPWSVRAGDAAGRSPSGFVSAAVTKQVDRGRRGPFGGRRDPGERRFCPGKALEKRDGARQADASRGADDWSLAPRVVGS